MRITDAIKRRFGKAKLRTVKHVNVIGYEKLLSAREWTIRTFEDERSVLRRVVTILGEDGTRYELKTGWFFEFDDCAGAWALKCDLGDVL